jgi:hypothetical protein
MRVVVHDNKADRLPFDSGKMNWAEGLNPSYRLPFGAVLVTACRFGAILDRLVMMS